MVEGLQARLPVEADELFSDKDWQLSAVWPVTRILLRGDRDVITAASSALNVPFFDQPLQSYCCGNVKVLWLGPDEFLILLPENAVDILRILREALQDIPHALTDISQRQIALISEGENAALVLNAGCPLDLDLEFFPVGRVCRTLFHKTEIIVWRVAQQRFHIEVWRSFSPYLVAYLKQSHAMIA